jgi:hypothetical protein
VEGKIERRGIAPDAFEVFLGRFAETVIEVPDGERDPELTREAAKNREETHGVGPARYGDEHPAAPRDEALSDHEVLHRLGESVGRIVNFR